MTASVLRLLIDEERQALESCTRNKDAQGQRVALDYLSDQERAIAHNAWSYWIGQRDAHERTMHMLAQALNAIETANRPRSPFR